jgi:hypothetical protein
MCIHCLGHFSPFPHLARFQADPVLSRVFLMLFVDFVCSLAFVGYSGEEIARGNILVTHYTSLLIVT